MATDFIRSPAHYKLFEPLTIWGRTDDYTPAQISDTSQKGISQGAVTFTSYDQSIPILIGQKSILLTSGEKWIDVDGSVFEMEISDLVQDTVAQSTPTYTITLNDNMVLLDTIEWSNGQVQSIDVDQQNNTVTINLSASGQAEQTTISYRTITLTLKASFVLDYNSPSYRLQHGKVTITDSDNLPFHVDFYKEYDTGKIPEVLITVDNGQVDFHWQVTNVSETGFDLVNDDPWQFYRWFNRFGEIEISWIAVGTDTHPES